MTKLGQRRPAAERAQDAFIALAKTCDALGWRPTELFRDHDVSMQQFNVLRILRGASPERLPCQEIASRMINRDPDITRLVDRLEKVGWVERHRSPEDRRVILVGITRAGIALLRSMDEPLLDVHERQFRLLKAAEVRTLIDLLARLRKGAE